MPARSIFHRRHLCTAALAVATLAAFTHTLPAAAAELTPFKVAMVSSIDTMPYFYAAQQGYYKELGLDVTLSTNDSGPAVVTGVLNGTYDAATAAAFPILIAISKGADLRVLAGAVVIRPNTGNSSLVVRKDSPIKGYKDLEGKAVATNALTSLTVLATKIGVKAAGGDGNRVKFLALPFKTASQSVAQGQADAAVVINPFGVEAEQAGMKIIADPIGTQLPAGAPYQILFTAAKTAQGKAAQFQAFEKATQRAIEQLKADPQLQRKLAVSLVGYSAEVAKAVTLPEYTTARIDPGAFQKYADLVAEYGYSAKPVEVAKVTITP
ncbi:MAG: ABC transporter substrate-binding protein [Rubrivivax sp.]|jgi:NitT/TauT family transport system substrate-binding protein|nr:ABC transporter substrate-binding protein [Rubrivivax sp.]